MYGCPNTRLHYQFFLGLQVEHDLLVEVTTGRQYSLNDSPYLSTDAVWNSEHYWVPLEAGNLTNLTDKEAWRQFSMPEGNLILSVCRL